MEDHGLIDSHIVSSVANAHALVTKLAWDGVMEYENLHKWYKNLNIDGDSAGLRNVFGSIWMRMFRLFIMNYVMYFFTMCLLCIYLLVIYY